CHRPVLGSSPADRLCYGDGHGCSCSDASDDPPAAAWGSGCRPFSTATGDALVRCKSCFCHLVDCRARYGASASTLASCLAGALLWHRAWLLLSCLPVHYSTTGGQGRFSIRELPHRAKLPVILLIGSYAECKLRRLC